MGEQGGWSLVWYGLPLTPFPTKEHAPGTGKRTQLGDETRRRIHQADQEGGVHAIEGTATPSAERVPPVWGGGQDKSRRATGLEHEQSEVFHPYDIVCIHSATIKGERVRGTREYDTAAEFRVLHVPVSYTHLTLPTKREV